MQSDDSTFGDEFVRHSKPICINTGFLFPTDEYEICDKIISQRAAARLFMGMVPTPAVVSRVFFHSLAAKRLATQLQTLRESKSCQPNKTVPNSFPNPVPTL